MALVVFESINRVQTYTIATANGKLVQTKIQKESIVCSPSLKFYVLISPRYLSQKFYPKIMYRIIIIFYLNTYKFHVVLKTIAAVPFKFTVPSSSSPLSRTKVGLATLILATPYIFLSVTISSSTSHSILSVFPKYPYSNYFFSFHLHLIYPTCLLIVSSCPNVYAMPIHLYHI